MATKTFCFALAIVLVLSTGKTNLQNHFNKYKKVKDIGTKRNEILDTK